MGGLLLQHCVVALLAHGRSMTCILKLSLIATYLAGTATSTVPCFSTWNSLTEKPPWSKAELKTSSFLQMSRVPIPPSAPFPPVKAKFPHEKAHDEPYLVIRTLHRCGSNCSTIRLQRIKPVPGSCRNRLGGDPELSPSAVMPQRLSTVMNIPGGFQSLRTQRRRCPSGHSPVGPHVIAMLQLE